MCNSRRDSRNNSGKELKQLVEGCGHTARELALEIGVSPSSFARWYQMEVLTNAGQVVYDAIIKIVGNDVKKEEEQSVVAVDVAGLTSAINDNSFTVDDVELITGVHIADSMNVDELKKVCLIIKQDYETYIVVEKKQEVAPVVVDLTNVETQLENVTKMLIASGKECATKKDIQLLNDRLDTLDSCFNKLSTVVTSLVKISKTVNEIVAQVNENTDRKFNAVVKALETESLDDTERAVLLINDLMKKCNFIIEETAFKQANILGIPRANMIEAKDRIGLISVLDKGKQTWKKRGV